MNQAVDNRPMDFDGNSLSLSALFGCVTVLQWAIVLAICTWLVFGIWINFAGQTTEGGLFVFGSMFILVMMLLFTQEHVAQNYNDKAKKFISSLRPFPEKKKKYEDVFEKFSRFQRHGGPLFTSFTSMKFFRSAILLVLVTISAMSTLLAVFF